MKILIISGFLGAGKTTFIQTMAKKTGKDFVIYENEYAGTGIDSGRLEAETQLNVWESLENCVCCSGKADFATAILTISGTLDPEYLVVEPTGVARLSRILSNIQAIQYDRISLLGPLAVVDAVNFQKQRRQFPDIFLDQVQAASAIVLSKTDQALKEEVERAAGELHNLNPEAELLTAPYTKQGRDWFSGILCRNLSAGGTGSATGAEAEEPPMDHLSLRDVALPNPVFLIALLDTLLSGAFGTIARAKGTLPCGREWIRFDLAGQDWIITGDDGGNDVSECAFIGLNLNRQGIRKILQEEIFISKRSIKKQLSHTRGNQIDILADISGASSIR